MKHRTLRVLILLLAVVAMPLMSPEASRAEVVELRLEYELDGTTFRGTLVYDDTKVSSDLPAPGVLVLPEWWGLNDYAHDRARQLAQLGYVAFAADLYGLDDHGQPRVTTDGAQAQQWAGTLYGDVPLWRNRLNAALSVLSAQTTVDADHLAAIGFCFGGASVQHLAYSGADLDAVVSFHGSPVVPTEEERARTRAAIFIAHGAADPFDPLDTVVALVEALEQSDIDYRVNLYGHAVHSFTNPAADGSFHPGAKHSPTAEPRAWADMRRWLREHFADAE